MKRTVAIGIQDFSTLRERNCFYIDKTSFIKEWWEREDHTTLIARPRRFGKTLNMSMLEQFFSVKYPGRADLFEGLSIWEEEKYRNLQGSYPVISLSFAEIKSNSYEQAKKEIICLIVGLYEKNIFLLDEEILTETEREYFKLVNWQMGDTIAIKAIQRLCDFLSRYYEKKAIILLDEYDTPMQEAYVNGYWEELVSFMRSLFNSTFKTNPYLERGLMTGITRVSKESIFSDLNHLEVVTTTANKYETAFGFTEEEVFQALEEFNLSEEKEGVKEWYDGFTFGKVTDIYNPWSILNFLDKKEYGLYWANTSSNSLVSKLIREGNRKVKSSLEQLLEGKGIRCTIDEQIVFGNLGDNEEAIWSLLLASGYLKVLSFDRLEKVKEGKEVHYELTLTNGEVSQVFHSMVRSWFREVEAEYEDFLSALLQGDVDAMNEYMNRISMEIFSYFDTGKRAYGSEPERFYHGFVLGLLVELKDRYRITSNRESGFGRYDVVLEPKEKELPAIILEFKVFNKRREKSLEETLQAALRQIEEKQYAQELLQRGVEEERIKKYGFAFFGKEVLIGNL